MSLTVEKCIEGWTNSLKQLRVKADIVFFGDSLTYYGDFASVFPDKVVCNLGLRGDTLQGLLDRVEQVGLLRPDKVYLMAGINNVDSATIDEFANSYDLLLESLQRCVSEADMVVFSILPINEKAFSIRCNNRQIKACNSRIETLSRKRGAQFIDVNSEYEIDGQLPASLTRDGIHLTSEAYNIWYNCLKK